MKNVRLILVKEGKYMGAFELAGVILFVFGLGVCLGLLLWPKLIGFK
ncbi:hypothetical protein [Sporomusa acidovorans]